MARDAAWLREQVEANRPSPSSDGYPDWLRREVALYAARVRPTAKTWAEVAATVGLSATTVLRWVGRAAAADAPSMGAMPLPGAGAPGEPASGRDVVPCAAPPPTAVERAPGSSSSRPGPTPSAGQRQPAIPSPRAATVHRPAKASRSAPAPEQSRAVGRQPSPHAPHQTVSAVETARGTTPERALASVGALAVRPVPVPVVALPDPPCSPGPPGRGGGEGAAGSLWLELPGGFRLCGLDLTSAAALLEAFR